MAEIVVALDLPSASAALHLVDSLLGVRWVKIGPTLFLAGGPALVRELKARGTKVFLDLKWHDIPHQVSGAVRAAVAAGVDLATVHALGGEEMMRSAVEAAAGSMRVVGVTVLTSLTPAAYGRAVGRRGEVGLQREVARLARMAVGSGLHGVVVSPLEVASVKKIVGEGGCVIVPGIRLPGTPDDDQQRTGEPAAAVRAGATHLVVGRPITQAAEPQAVYQRLCEAAT